LLRQKLQMFVVTPTVPFRDRNTAQDQRRVYFAAQRLSLG
jgi:hypothetical protein